MTSELIAAVVNLQEATALELCRLYLAEGIQPRAIVAACRRAMRVVSQHFVTGRIYLPELILAVEIMKAAYTLLEQQIPHPDQHKQPAGRVVIGTVAGDIHDIGKDIVVFLLDANEFQVYDLGVDVPVDLFLDKISEVEPDIVGLSGFLTLAFDSMREIVTAIAAAGLRERVKIMVGGAPVDEVTLSYIGADAYGQDAVAAVRLAQDWVAPQPDSFDAS